MFNRYQIITKDLLKVCLFFFKPSWPIFIIFLYGYFLFKSLKIKHLKFFLTLRLKGTKNFRKPQKTQKTQIIYSYILRLLCVLWLTISLIFSLCSLWLCVIIFLSNIVEQFSRLSLTQNPACLRYLE
jgi:hypothetical protein